MCINTKKGMAAGFVMLVSSIIISILFNMLFPSISLEYNNTQLYRSWSDPIMYYMFIHPFIFGILLSAVWEKTNILIQDKDELKKGAMFGIYIWGIFSLPGILVTWSTSPISILITFSWIVSVLVQYVTAGITFAKMK